jgi:aminopeptidase N
MLLMKYVISFIFICFSVTLIAQQSEFVDFINADAQININAIECSVSGQVEYNFKVLKEVDSIYLDAKNFKEVDCILDKRPIDIRLNNKFIVIKQKFKKGETHKLNISWSTQPKKAMYFVGWDNNAPDQVWTQGQGKYTSNWLPSFDDVNEKVEFDLNVDFDKNYEVISNGKLVKKETHDGYNSWHYDMQNPMSSYLVGLAIGKYKKKIEHSKSGIPLEMYYYPEDSMKVEPTYRYTKRMFDFLENEIGVPYPWQNYKLIPVHDFLYAGMENSSATIFSDAFMIDETSFVDRNFVNVNAHELAHQWFGDLVTAKSGEHHWLQEGFATYYALLAEKELFGEDYYYWRLYEYAQELLSQDKSGQSTSLLDPKSSSTTFYKKGAWTLHILKEQVGDKAFKNAVKSYLKKHRFKNVETMDFLKEIQVESGQDLTNFIATWLNDKTFPEYEAYSSLEKNEFAKGMLQMQKFDSETDIIKQISKCDEVLHADSFYPLQQELFARIKNVDSLQAIQLYKKAFSSNDIKKRQAIAMNLKEIPIDLRADYESLLNDRSYVTVETALFNLWNSFPQDQEIYLEKTKGINGFNNKNVRTLWLTLAILTDNDSFGDPEHFLEELIGYTSPDYSFEVRENAFRYLRWIRSCEERCMENLKDATNHHNWRFKQFAQQLMDNY